MLIIEGKNIQFEARGREILNIDELKIYEGDRIGLIGCNGSGKSTLVKIIMGELKPSGQVIKINGSIGYVPQVDDVDHQYDTGAIYKQFKVGDKQYQEEVSGGEYTRLKLASVLNEDTHMIIMDEPTNHMDEEGVNTLERQLERYTGSLLIVSHNRTFIDNVCNKIWVLEDKEIKEYVGNYTSYIEEKEKMLRHQKRKYEVYQHTKRHLQVAKEEKIKKANKIMKENKKLSPSDKRSKPLATGTRAIETRQKQLHKAAKAIDSRMEQLEEVKKPMNDKTIDFSIPYKQHVKSTYTLIAKNINKRYGEHIILQDAHIHIKNGSKVALVGANGIGKTTLIKMLVSDTEEVVKARGLKIGYFDQKLEGLDETLTVIENAKKDSDYSEKVIRMYLGQMLFKGRDIEKCVGVLSGGERVRLSLCKLLIGRYNMLIMDEPTNFLDIESIEAVEKAMKQYTGTLLFTSHDEKLIYEVADEVLQIHDKKIRIV
ncbi:MAG: ribosomal protection-like ABC-F family protein [Cellulosilyticaceae bacterium]